jgi:amicyanin
MNVRTALSLLVLLAATFSPAAAADAVDVIAPESAPADAVKVDIAKMKFVPATIEIEAGSTVTWTNHDAVPHNVYLPAPIEVIGDMLRAGKSLALKFNTPGEYSYICSPHPYMKGKVTVKPKS